ncbi:MAG: amidohydrolase [Desulfobacterales bacterium]|jgi:predicted amidohydrolase|nr:amidohydrolase [Desulfobacterales bacterium]
MNLSDLKVTLVQTALFWEDASLNLAMFDETLETISRETDLIVLPEMFSTGFSMAAAKHAEGMDGRAVRWLRETSRKKSVDIVGSLMIRDKNRFFNRLLWAKPDGVLLTYDKRHLFRMAGEEKVYSAGNSLLTVRLKGWKIRPFICYDLRFPAWTRNVDNAYDLAVFVANWPEKRSLHWQKLLVARAIENQCFVVGVNRVGKDGHGVNFSGDSVVIDPVGIELVLLRYEPCVHTVNLSGQQLLDYRKNFPAWMDADADLINIKYE